ncbi:MULTISPECIES: hypothetical protein [Kocuria]|uniref:hypothetical protein n=1 Tax=Kocuria TaxID=57493 RepID=UPI0007EA5BA2|nr:hypothetical protein [Kocuria sp. ICS0012]OBA51394.1 hypothetical protein A5728_00030 [Kocuria sp. ICS0012]
MPAHRHLPPPDLGRARHHHPNIRANTVLDALAGAAEAPASLTGDAIVTGYTADFDTAGLSCAEARALRKATGVHPHPHAANSPAPTH